MDRRKGRKLTVPRARELDFHRQGKPSGFLTIPLVAALGVIVAIFLISGGCGKAVQKSVEQVTVKAADGYPLRGTIWLPGGRGPHPGVLMLANLNQDRGVYKSLGEQLADTGLVAFALDLRVQGGSIQAGAEDPFSPHNLKNLAQDAYAGLNYLRQRRDVDPRRIGLLAADGVVALVHRTIWTDSAIVAVALLSPIVPDSLVETLATQPPRPLFLASSFDDPSAAQVTKALADASPNARSFAKFFFACGHGTDMLWSPEGANLTRLLRDWLVDVLRD